MVKHKFNLENKKKTYEPNVTAVTEQDNIVNTLCLTSEM